MKLAFLDNIVICATSGDLPRFGKDNDNVIITNFDGTYDDKYEYSYIENDDGSYTAIQGEEKVIDPAIEEQLLKEYNDNKYKEERKYSYPPIGDQLDALFHAGAFPQEMAARIQAVKDTYPKPENN